MRNSGGPRPKGSSETGDVAAYVASLSAELSVLSRRNGLSTLAYLLDMARLEADTLARAARDDDFGERPSAPGV